MIFLHKKNCSVAVIDIGSNSIRLVVYKGLAQYPVVLFNEKVLCALGKAVSRTGHLDESSMNKALNTLKRFKTLCARANISSLYVFATAAVRDADNGHAFTIRAEKILGTQVHVLSGSEEGEYSARGIIASFHDPVGLIGDLGGGSLELAYLDNKEIDGAITLPLGGLALQEKAKDLKDAARITDLFLQKSKSFSQKQIDKFYAVGGTWRNIAKLYMYSSDYPLPLPHALEISASPLKGFLNKLVKEDLAYIKAIGNISKKRRQLLSYGAVVLLQLMKHYGFKKIVFSSTGVREGYIYSQLPEKIQAKDPLIMGVKDICALSSGASDYCAELFDWLQKSLAFFNFKQNERQKTCLKALTYFIYVGEDSFADCRGTQVANQIALGAYYGASHEERAFMALVLFFYHKGIVDKAMLPAYASLLKESTVNQLKVLAGLMRVAGCLSMHQTGLLPKLAWEKSDKGFSLVIPKTYQGLISDIPIAKLQDLVKIMHVALSYRLGR